MNRSVYLCKAASAGVWMFSLEASVAGALTIVVACPLLMLSVKIADTVFGSLSGSQTSKVGYGGGVYWSPMECLFSGSAYAKSWGFSFFERER